MTARASRPSELDELNPYKLTSNQTRCKFVWHRSGFIHPSRHFALQVKSLYVVFMLSTSIFVTITSKRYKVGERCVGSLSWASNGE